MQSTGRTCAGEFPGTERFHVERRLGAGGMGVVYHVHDRERDLQVALKALKHLDARAVSRFKKEFRALADLEHRNLVRLGELFCERGRWFFTMELVEGQHLLDYVRPVSDGTVSVTEDTLRARYDEVRLRRALGQLAEGVAALHLAQKVHRDIKPSNVIVTTDDRVVLLDFGLVLDTSQGDVSDLGMVGTAAYMAPEQTAAHPVGPAADWYSVGAVIYEALVGRAPFLGTHMEVLLAKQRYEPPAPHALVRDAPADLDALCVDLLRMDPGARPTGREVLARLGVKDAVSQDSPSSLNSLTDGVSFVGRGAEVGILRQAFADSQKDGAVTVFVQGESGLGKTRLVRHFVDEFAVASGALALWGSCYERESVPYKAFDSIMDAISQRLAGLDPVDAALLLPKDVAVLRRVFPALKRVLAVSRATAPEIPDPQELRSRAFQALRQLLGRLAGRQPLVLVIDDFQWTDDDSASLLRDVLRPPNAPPLLLVATVQTGGSNSRASELALRLADGLGDVRHLLLEGLLPSDARALALGILGDRGDASRFEAILAEAAGHPVFLQELARHIRDEGERGDHRLEDIFWSRVQRLDESARLLLEVVAVADAPLAQHVAQKAAGLCAEAYARSLKALRVTHLLRSDGARSTDVVQTYHSRARQAALARLPPERQHQIHGMLADALEVAGDDPLGLVRHLEAVEQREHAAEHAVRAARRASEALAFGQAAELYRTALRLGHFDLEHGGAIQRELGHALVNAGRGAEAAQAYQAAAKGASPAMAHDLHRRAAEQLLRSGHVEEGLVLLGPVLAAVGLPSPRPSRGALLTLLVERARLRWRGLDYVPRHESDLPASLLTRLDVCWSASVGLAPTFFFASAAFQTRSLRLALDAGEPYRLVRALAAEAGFAGAQGPRGRPRAALLLDKAARLAREVQRPYAIAVASVAAAMVAIMEGRWRECMERSQFAEAFLRDHCDGVTWERGCMHLVYLSSLAQLGHMGELCRCVPVYLREAEERGDLYQATALRTADANLAWLARDDAEGARREATIASQRYSRKATLIQDYLDLLAQVRIDLYQGDGRLASTRLASRWPALKRSLFLNVQLVRGVMWHLRACTALSSAKMEHGSARANLLRAAKRDARRLAGEDAPWITALSLLVRASIASVQGDTGGAASLYGQAASHCEGADMSMHAAFARWRKGELMGGDEGQPLIARAQAFCASQGIKNPARMLEMVVP